MKMRTTVSRFCNVGLLGTALMIPVATAPLALRAQDRTYHDQGRNDDHQWNTGEDRAYRAWLKENHRKYKDFAKLKKQDQESYWAWRHEHPDAH